MNIIAQICDMKAGQRTPAIKIDTADLVNNLIEFLKDSKHEKYAVIVIMDEAKGEWDFSTAPFITAQNFIKHFANKTRETDNG